MDTLIQTKFQVMFDCCRYLLKSLDKNQISQQFVKNINDIGRSDPQLSQSCHALTGGRRLSDNFPLATNVSECWKPLLGACCFVTHHACHEGILQFCRLLSSHHTCITVSNGKPVSEVKLQKKKQSVD